MKFGKLVFAGFALAIAGGAYGVAHYLDWLPAGARIAVAKSVAQGAGDEKATNTTGRSGGSARRGRRGRGGPVPVLVGSVVERPTPQLLKSIGSVVAFATVSVKSRVDGQLLKVGFVEGQTVHAGEPLFEIDPRPFQVQLRQARASLARDRAQAEKMKGDVARYGTLVGKGFASQQKYEEARAAYFAMEATLQADEAAIEAARLQLAYTTIQSPIDGRTGNLLVNGGNLVKANDSLLVVITQLRPINVTFSVPEHFLPRLKVLLARGGVPVSVEIPGDTGPPRQGKLAFINNAVDTATGTIQIKAEFDNNDDALTPGQFVNVALTLKERPSALVIPSQAVQEGQRGQFVFVVGDDSTVAVRPVTVEDIAGDVSVIAKGLSAGERVVLDGQLQLRPGAKVVERKPRVGRPDGERRRGEGRGNRSRGEGRRGKPQNEARAEQSVRRSAREAE